MKPLSRRQFIFSATAGLASLAFSPLNNASQKWSIDSNRRLLKTITKEQVFVSASGASKSTYALGWIFSNQSKVLTAHSKFRGHSVAFNPFETNSVIMFGRRPSTQLMKVNLHSGKIDKLISCDANRHFFGHGCFSDDGKKLYTSEALLSSNSRKPSIGIIGVRDPLTLEKISEFKSGAIGPHEIKFLPNSNILVVANGGIYTRPESGRKMLNLETMQSNLSYFDVSNNKLVDVIKVPERKASIRHFDIAPDGRVVFSMQIQRQAAGHNQTVALAGSHKLGEAIRLFDKPETLINQMNDYIGSVAVHPETRGAGFTSPRGNVVAFWQIDSGKLVGYHQLTDACGICITQDQRYFALSNSQGQIRLLDANSLKENKLKRQINSNVRWDNHLTSINI